MREIIREEAPGLHVSISSDIVPAMQRVRAVGDDRRQRVRRAAPDRLPPAARGRTAGARPRVARCYVMQSMGGAMRAADAENAAVNTLASGLRAASSLRASSASMLGHEQHHLRRRRRHELRRRPDRRRRADHHFDDRLSTSTRCSCRRSTSFRSAPAAARSRGSISAGCGSGRTAPAPIRARPATAAAACSRRSPMRTSCSATSTPTTSSAARSSSTAIARDARRSRRRSREPLSMSVRDAAAGIIEIANHHMSDLIRKMTIERGYDPRDFVVYALRRRRPAAWRRVRARARRARRSSSRSGTSPRRSRPSASLCRTDHGRPQLSDLALAPFDPERCRTASSSALEKEAVDEPHRRGAKRAKHRRCSGFSSSATRARFTRSTRPSRSARLRPAEPRRRDRGVRAALRDALRPRLRFPPGGDRARDLPSARLRRTSRTPRSEEQDEGSRRRRRRLASAASSSTGARSGKDVETGVYGSGLRPGMAFDGPAVIRLEATTGARPSRPACAEIDGYGNIRITHSEYG